MPSTENAVGDAETIADELTRVAEELQKAVAGFAKTVTDLEAVTTQLEEELFGKPGQPKPRLKVVKPKAT